MIKMAIILETTKFKVYEYYQQLCDYAAWDKTYRDLLWSRLLDHEELYDEFVYYLEHHQILGTLTFRGYSLIDLYVWQMDRYNLIHDIGKNTGNCNKEDLVLKAFYAMTLFFDDPDSFEKRLKEGRGMDYL